ncbi:MAG: hypothetical protein WC880_03075 [Candidatus Paceibacterota bacterium]
MSVDKEVSKKSCGYQLKNRKETKTAGVKLFGGASSQKYLTEPFSTTPESTHFG